jgi:tetratricopeptide (TPR) repeat protein
VQKQQVLLVLGGISLLCVIYFFGNTYPPKKNNPVPASKSSKKPINIDTILAAAKQQLTADQYSYVNKLENSVVRGDVKDQQIKVYRQLASFWKDSGKMLIPYAWYLGELGKLEKSEKNLTFAAHLFSDNLRGQPDPELKIFMAEKARELYEGAIVLNPENDSLKVALGSCYLFGNIGEPMKGIQMIRDVADRDPDNMYAQLMLGIGGVMSGQLDKAIERLHKVVQIQPQNIEALLTLAEAYERKGDKANAMKWYEVGKKFIESPAIVQEIDHRINELKR